MVVSYSSPRKPHLVTMFSNGKITCDCLNYVTKSLCAHTLATAEKNGVLKNLLDWRKGENKLPNLWSLARSSGVPKHPGDKPHTSKRKRSRVSRQPPKTFSKPCPSYTGIGSPGNSPNPKRNSSYSGNVSQAGTNSEVLASLNSPLTSTSGCGNQSGANSPLHQQSSPGSFNTPGSFPGSLTSANEWSYPYGNTFHSAYNPPPPWYQTPTYPFPPPLPSSFSSPPYMGYHPLPASGPFTPLPPPP